MHAQPFVIAHGNACVMWPLSKEEEAQAHFRPRFIQCFSNIVFLVLIFFPVANALCIMHWYVFVLCLVLYVYIWVLAFDMVLHQQARMCLCASAYPVCSAVPLFV